MAIPRNPSLPVDLLYVDLDGTLTPSDSLVESLLALVRKRPSTLLRLPGWLVRGRLHLKAQVAAADVLEPDDLPYREDLLVDLRSWRAGGAELVLATAAHEKTAAAVADHLGLFDSVLSSDEATNLSGHAKLAAIERHAGGRAYGYVGNAVVDVPILAAADAAFITGPRADVIRKRLSGPAPVEIYGETPRRGREYWRLMRPRHWLKNLLLFVPVLASQQVSRLSAIGAAAVAFVAFSLIASGSYALNDVLDVHADRRHPVKAARPVAAGTISVTAAIAFALLLIGAGFAVAAFLPAGFTLVLGVYLGVSLLYSLVLKRLLLLDVVTLAAVFVLRVIAGAEAIEVTASFWLLAFSLFFFASLALTKRCSELHNLEGDADAVSHGRAYRAGDLAILQTIGAAAGVVSVLVLALYIEDPASEAVYSRPELLWLLTPLLLYWISRTWIKAGRGELTEDPLLFAASDAASWVVTLLSLAVILAAV